MAFIWLLGTGRQLWQQKNLLTTGFLAKSKQEEASEKQTALDTAYGE